LTRSLDEHGPPSIRGEKRKKGETRPFHLARSETRRSPDRPSLLPSLGLTTEWGWGEDNMNKKIKVHGGRGQRGGLDHSTATEA